MNVKSIRIATIRPLYLVLLTLLALELLWAVVYLSQPLKLVPDFARLSSPAFLTTREVSLSLSPDSQEVKLGESFTATIVLDTAGREVNAVDVVLDFDQDMFEVVEGKAAAGKAFDRYFRNAAANDKGLFTLSAAMDPGKSFKGKATLATLTLTGKKSGSSIVSIRFKEGSTVDSNVSFGDEATPDLLEKVVNAEVTLR